MTKSKTKLSDKTMRQFRLGTFKDKKTKPRIPPMQEMIDGFGKVAPTKPDPMKALRKIHPTPWREIVAQRWYRYYYVYDANGILLADCCSKKIARAICRMGNGK